MKTADTHVTVTYDTPLARAYLCVSNLRPQNFDWAESVASRVERDTQFHTFSKVWRHRLIVLMMSDDVNLQCVERSLHFALQRVNENISFVLHKVRSGFCPHTSFSRCEFDLAVHDIEMETAATLHFDTLFKVKDPEFDPALEFIHHCRRKLWPPYNLEKQRTN